MKSAIFACGVIVSGSAVFSSAILAAEVDVQFTIKPRLCILAQGETECNDELQMHWRTGDPVSICIAESLQDEPLHCWENVSEGHFAYMVSAVESKLFQLRSSSGVIAEQTFEIVHDDKRYRRSRKNPWSFFS